VYRKTDFCFFTEEGFPNFYCKEWVSSDTVYTIHFSIRVNVL